jgi:hypothetical protein
MHNLGNPATVSLTFGFNFVNNVRHSCILARTAPLNFKSLPIKFGKSLADKAVIFRGSRRKFANLRNSLSSIQRAEPLINRRHQLLL